MEVVCAIISPIVDSFMGPIKKHLGYWVSCKKHVKEMTDQMEILHILESNVRGKIESNTRNNLSVPTPVPAWLEEVENIKADAERIPTHVNNCLYLKSRYKIGKTAFATVQEIDRLKQQNSVIEWTNRPIPLGKVDSKKASTSVGDTQNDFKSRDKTFKQVLEALQLQNEARVIALFGMGGVGKTTMVEQLKKVVENKQMFNNIVWATIGEKTNLIVVQQAIADYLSLELTERTEKARADRLCKHFESLSGQGKKILVILDDIWEMFDLKDIGLSLLPNRDGCFKFLLTSRDEGVCRKMGAETNSIFKVEVMKDDEALNFFYKNAGILDNVDPKLYQIGQDIVRRCGGLPFAITTIASTLKGKSIHAWSDALHRLKNNDLQENVHKIIEISYNHLERKELEEVFLLCGLFPEDFDIPIKELLWYAWGLKLLNRVPTFQEARNRLKVCVEGLKSTNLLLASNADGCVKMHDLVRAFVLNVASEGDHPWIVNHGNMLEWPTEDTSDSYERLSLTCTGVPIFPRQLSFPNLTLLKLMRGDWPFFRDEFYGGMGKLKVIAFEEMNNPLLPGPLPYSTNLRTLCLHSCSLTVDFSALGDLINLEILSFDGCRIQKLPSTIGKLRKLKLLDLTGCINLLIDDGIFENLKHLEELYMGVSYGKAIRFTDANCNELSELSKNLSALEVEFFQNKSVPKNMSFKNLDRFSISVGCYLKINMQQEGNSFENTLMLVTERKEELESGITGLFEKTEVLHLQVGGMNNVEDILVESYHHPGRSLFGNLKVLDVSKCADLTYAFTLPVARSLSKLQRLTISLCPDIEELIHVEAMEAGTIRFPELKFLSLDGLPNLISLCRNADLIELPELVELSLVDLPNFTSIYPGNKSASFVSSNNSITRSFLSKEVATPKLEQLDIRRMNNLKHILPSELSGSEEVTIYKLRKLAVYECDNLVTLFPSNPMLWLHHLEAVDVRKCGSVEVIFTLDLGCINEVEEGCSSLRRIELRQLEKLTEVWRIEGVSDSHHIIRGFQAVTHIYAIECKSLRNIFTPTTTIFDLRALENICIEGSEHLGESGGNNGLAKSMTNTQCKQINVVSKGKTSMLDDNNSYNVAFMSLLVRENMESVFHNLTSIRLDSCGSIKYLFSLLMATLVPNLKIVEIGGCNDMEEIVSDEKICTSAFTHTNTAFIPLLDALWLTRLPSLKRIGGGGGIGSNGTTPTTTYIHDQSRLSQTSVASWSLCQYSRKIDISRCDALSSVIPSHALGQMQKLEQLDIYSCSSMVEIFEMQGINKSVGEGSGGSTNIATISTIPRMKNMNLLQLSNLKVLIINKCNRLQHVFIRSTLESLKQLKELWISNCKEMQVIVKEDDEEHATSSKVMVFPRLQFLRLKNLPNFKGFFLGMNDFEWPLLDDVMIQNCPQMKMFTSGHSTAPKLNYIRTGFGKFSLEHGLNFHVMVTTSDETQFQSLYGTWEEMCLSFSSLIQVDVQYNNNIECIISSNELLQMQKVEEVKVRSCRMVEEVFEAFEGTNSGLNESVVFPKLRVMTLYSLDSLRYIWKNNQWTTLEFPSLTKVSISRCMLLGHVFTCSMVGSLPQLQELHIRYCENMEVIVKEDEDSETKVKEVVFPCLKSIRLQSLPILKGFCLGKEDFIWPSFDTLEIKKCPEIMVFTNGRSSAPMLNQIDTTVGWCHSLEELNFIIQEGFEF